MDKRLLTVATAGATALAVPGAASAAAPTQDGTSQVILLNPLAFLNVEDVLFGSVIVPKAGTGTMYIDPLGAAPVYTNLDPILSSTPRRGWLVGAGEPGQSVVITATLPTALYMDGDSAKPSVPVSLIFDHLRYSTPTQYWDYTVTSKKTYNIYVGGTLTVPSGTAPGTYSNQFTVTATYP